jgi:hypothetical protein
MTGEVCTLFFEGHPCSIFHGFGFSTSVQTANLSAVARRWMALGVLVLAAPAALAQFDFTTNAGGNSITITGYDGPPGAVVIPGTIMDLPVTDIGTNAFQMLSGLTSVTIPGSVTNIAFFAFYACLDLTNATISDGVANIGNFAFSYCPLASVTIPGSATNIGYQVFFHCAELASVTMGHGVTTFGDFAFYDCYSLTNVVFADSVSSIGVGAFQYCYNLAAVTIPDSVTGIGDDAFQDCLGLEGVYFTGNEPFANTNVFDSDNEVTAYYLPGTTGWGTTFGGAPAAPWLLPNPLILTNGPSFGAQSNSFGFLISWATNTSVVVEACMDLVNPHWSPVATNPLVGGSSFFSESRQTNTPSRYYRIRWP